MASHALPWAEVLSLRDQGALTPGCQYWVTDYARGTPGLSLIGMRALTESTMGPEATVLTAHSTTPWQGSYDLTSNRLTALRDDRGNAASGAVGDEVDAFPWGDSRYTECVVAGARWYADQGTAGAYHRVSVRDGALLDTRNCTASFYEVQITSQAQCLLSSVQGGQFTAVEVTTNARVVLTGQLSPRVEHTVISAGAMLTATSNGQLTVQYSTLGEQSSVSVRTGALLLRSSSLQGQSLLSHTGTGTLTLQGMSLLGRGRCASDTSGAALLYYSTVGGQGEVVLSGSSSPRLYYSSVQDLARVQLLDSSPRLYYSHYGSYGSVLHIRADLAHYGVQVMSGGILRATDCSLRPLAYSQVADRSALTITGMTTGQVYYAVLSGSSQQQYGNTSALQVTTSAGFILRAGDYSVSGCYGLGPHAQTLTANNTGKARDSFTSSFI